MPLPLRFAACAALALGGLVWTPIANCQEEGVPREHHAWGRFLPGAWKSVRVVTETFDPDGRVTSMSVTESKTTLSEATAECYTLTIESSVEVAGKRIDSPPQQVNQCYDGTAPGQEVQTRSLGTGRVTIDGSEYPCEVRRIEVTGAASRTVTKMHYCSRIAPYVMRRESDSTDLSTGAVTGRATMQVMALDMPHKILAETRSTTHCKYVQQHDKGSTITLIVNCLDVPGGVVAHTSKELDPQGRLVRRSTLELTDYGAVHVENRDSRRPRLFRRHKMREGGRHR